MMLILFLSTALAADATAQVAPEVGKAREKLERILARAEFQQWKRREERKMVDKTSFIERWADQLKWFDGYFSWLNNKMFTFWDWIRDLWKRWFGSGRDRSPGESGGMGTAQLLQAAGWIVLISLVPLLTYVIVQVSRNTHVPTSARILSRELVRDALDSGQALSLSKQEWMEVADTLQEEGDFRSLYRALYLALLSGLHQRGSIDFRLSRTNWHYVQRFRGTPADQQIFGSLTELFDDVWYGGREAPRSRIEEFRQQVRTLLAQTGDSRG